MGSHGQVTKQLSMHADMYGKMQEPGLTEIIPLICASALWGQYPVFSHPEFPQGSPLKGVDTV